MLPVNIGAGKAEPTRMVIRPVLRLGRLGAALATRWRAGGQALLIDTRPV
jgi:hypothetical protein